MYYVILFNNLIEYSEILIFFNITATMMAYSKILLKLIELRLWSQFAFYLNIMAA